MTPMSMPTMLDKDEDAEEVDQKASPRASHCTAVKRILRYIKFTPEFGLWYFTDASLSLLGSSDADFTGCRLDCKSTSGALVLGYLVSLLILWMLSTLKDYGLTYGRMPPLCDSSSAISVAKNLVPYSRTKHIDVRYHFLRDNFEKGLIDLVKVESENQVVSEGVDKTLIKKEIKGLNCTKSSLSSRL
ncbi:hypothetical protein U9M48_002662 [Paspalum notatum var. saurae]|uniref:Uncharacterized protein n=1 Tax=Paspalum notatum var. saurae TaxID=547442 RepID=A0AAQ3PK63_PASNO